MPRKYNRRNLNATVTAEQYQAVTEAAEKCGEGLAEFIRTAVGERVIQHGIEWPDLPGQGKYDRSADMERAIEEFEYLESHIGGYKSASYKSSNGYEFVTWLDEGDEPPEVNSPLIEVIVDREDETFEGMYKFSMTLPIQESERS
jgi:hypothetical protein